MADSDSKKAWHQLDDESAQAYAAFIAYCELGAERSIDGAWRVAKGEQESSKRAPGRWMQWSCDYHWVERAAAYDKEIAESYLEARKQKHIEEIDAYREKHLRTADNLYTLADDFMRVVKRRLAKIDEIEDAILGAAIGNASDELTVVELKKLSRNYDLKTIAYTFGTAIKAVEAALNSEGAGLGVTKLLATVEEKEQKKNA